MGDTKRSSKDVKKRDAVPLPQIRNTFELINAHICSAQAHLVVKSSEMIAKVEKTEFSPPTAYRQVIDARGHSRLERLSELRLSLGSLLTPGVFRIQSVEVELPESNPREGLIMLHKVCVLIAASILTLPFREGV